MFDRRWVGVFWGFKAASLQGTVAAALEAVQNPGGLRSDLPFLAETLCSIKISSLRPTQLCPRDYASFSLLLLFIICSLPRRL